MNGKSSGFLSGAAGGAAIGAEIGGVYGAAIGGVIGGVAGLFQGGAADSANEAAMRTARYNAMMQYNINMDNANSRYMLGVFNSALAIKAADLRAKAISNTAEYNAKVIKITTEYNNNLLENEQELIWDKAGLDLKILHNIRARERGQIVADQAASGTVIGEGTNADIIIDQKTQEALDAFIIRHQADINWTAVENQKASNTWQGNMAIQKLIYEGKLSSYLERSNAAMQAGATLMTTQLNYSAAKRSAAFAGNSAYTGIGNYANAYSQQNTVNMVNGLFKAGNIAIRNYRPSSEGGSLLTNGSEEFDYTNSWAGGGKMEYYNTWGE